MESAFAVCSGLNPSNFSTRWLPPLKPFLGFLKELIPIVDNELPGSFVLSDLFKRGF